jgi:hypothetical protein
MELPCGAGRESRQSGEAESLQNVEDAQLLSIASLSPETSIVPSAVSLGRDTAFFISFLPGYASYVYPMSPVIPESEVRTLITQMGDSAEASSFVFVFVTITLNLSHLPEKHLYLTSPGLLLPNASSENRT